MRPATLAGTNRGRLRGWGLIGAIGFAILAILSWPSLLSFAVFLVAGAACMGAVAWVHFTLPEVETEEYQEQDSPAGGQD
jgi:predicted tellurium resistance membrane protein TerC